MGLRYRYPLKVCSWGKAQTIYKQCDKSFFHSIPRTEHLLVTVPAAMSCGTDASTGECDYEGNTSLISLCHLADVPHQDACETSSFSHLSPLRPSRLVFKLQCEEGRSDSGLWVQERKGFCCSASASAAKEDFSLAVSSTALCLCGKRLRRKILIEHRAVVMHCSTGDQHCYKSCNILELVISEYYIWFGCRVSVEKKTPKPQNIFLEVKTLKNVLSG